VTRPTVQPVLMSSDVALLASLASAPPEAQPAAVAVDWERPDERSTGLDRRPAAAQVAALAAVREVSPWPVVCRVNEVGPGTEDEVEQAVDLGADEVLVPMVRSEAEVERVLKAARGRFGVGIMVETPEAVDRAASLARLGISRAFVGLLDLAVERGTPSVFTALGDGTVDRLVAALAPTAYGFGGLTDPVRGHPLPARLLMGEIVRGGCSFAMMRNAFVADSALSSPAVVLASIRHELARLSRRDIGQVADDRSALLARIAVIDAGVAEQKVSR
jgi:riboflavin biosynthesis pyrimidine reductase